MDRSAVHLLTHPEPGSGIDSGRILEIIFDIAGSGLIEFELESTITEVCVETAASLGIAGCAVDKAGGSEVCYPFEELFVKLAQFSAAVL